jgi:hypothetical protein
MVGRVIRRVMGKRKGKSGGWKSPWRRWRERRQRARDRRDFEKNQHRQMAAMREARAGLIETSNGRALELAKRPGFIGQRTTNVRSIGSGRLRGFTATNTESPGGLDTAQALFRVLTGRSPTGPVDGVVTRGLEVQFRAIGRSGHPKVEIVNHATRAWEKVTFVP